METIVIYVSGGSVQSIHKVTGSPHNRVIVLDDDNIEGADCPATEALSQLEGHEFDSTIKYFDIVSTLSQKI